MKIMSYFKDRSDAGRLLSERLSKYNKNKNVLILALPRGGVPVAYEIAKSIDAPLDVFIVRKLGVPGHEELAMGAIATGDVQVLNKDVVRSLHISGELIDAEVARERLELQRRLVLYRGSREFPDIKDKIIILVDDGLATGATMYAAISAIKEMKAKKIIVAVPVASDETCNEMENKVDDMICLHTPEFFGGVGAWYDDFSQTSDEDVKEILHHYFNNKK
jgi:predicted phosphoribosyltransferase